MGMTVIPLVKEEEDHGSQELKVQHMCTITLGKLQQVNFDVGLGLFGGS